MMTIQSDMQQAPTAAGGASLLHFLHGPGLNVLLAAASGVCMALIFPPFDVWWLAWVSLAPLLIALRRTVTVRAAGWLMLLFGIVYFACALSWLGTIFHGGVIGIYVLLALPWVLFGVAYRLAVGRKTGILLALLAPVLFLAMEWIRCEGWYFQFSWGQFGYALAACRHGGALYRLIGVYGVTFLIVLVNAVLVELILMRARFSRKLLCLAPLALALLLLPCYLAAPFGKPAAAAASGHALRALIVQDENGVQADLYTQTRAASAAGVDLVLWPEYAVMDYPLAKPKVLSEAQALARTLHCTLVFGCKDHAPATAHVDWLRRRDMLLTEGALFYNTALVIGPDGAVLGKYYKTHPIQLFSDGVPGRAYPSFSTPAGRLGIAICYDFDYASTARRLVQHGAELLLAPTFDARDWPDIQHTQHARMAQARAAECARWVVRATSSGVSQFIDPQGQVTALIPNGATAALLSSVTPRSEITPYVRFGYRLPELCLLLSLLGLGWLTAGWVRRRWPHK